MDALDLEVVQHGISEDLNCLLETFIEHNGDSFKLSVLDCTGRRKKAFAALIERISKEVSLKCKRLSLQVLRILSRDKSGLESTIDAKLVETILKEADLIDGGPGILSNNTEQRSFQYIGQHLAVILESQKCLCNLLFNSRLVQSTCSNNGCIESIVQRMKSFDDQRMLQATADDDNDARNLLKQVKYFDMRLLFLITALCPDTRLRLRRNQPCMTGLCDSLQDGLQQQQQQVERTATNNIEQPQHTATLDESQAELSCEVLKVLFNVTACRFDESTMSDDDQLLCARLTSLLHDLLLCSVDNPQLNDQLKSHTVNLLTNMPNKYVGERLIPAIASDAAEASSSAVEQQQEMVIDGYSMSAVEALLQFLLKRLERIAEKRTEDTSTRSQQELLTPILSLLVECVRHHRSMRKYVKKRVLPPRRDVDQRPEEADSLRGYLCRLLTSPVNSVSTLTAELLFLLCKESVARMVKHTGYGNAAGLLANRGLLLGSAPPMSIASNSQYSSDSDSDTEEYLQLKDQINPVTGRYEPPRPDPMAGMSDEQKEYEAIQLVNLIEKLSREGVVRPCRIDADGRPRPVGHILELQDEPHQNGNQTADENNHGDDM